MLAILPRNGLIGCTASPRLKRLAPKTVGSTASIADHYSADLTEPCHPLQLHRLALPEPRPCCLTAGLTTDSTACQIHQTGAPVPPWQAHSCTEPGLSQPNPAALTQACPLFHQA